MEHLPAQIKLATGILLRTLLRKMDQTILTLQTTNINRLLSFHENLVAEKKEELFFSQK